MSSPFSTLYDTVKARLEAAPFSADLEVTHYTLSLGADNATTGVPATSYDAGAAIDMIILSKAAAQLIRDTGLYVKRDALGLTKTAVAEGDRIKDADDNYYTVVSVLPQPVGDIIAYYSVDLTYNPML